MSKVKNLSSDEIYLLRNAIETKNENNEVQITEDMDDFLLVALEFQGYIEIIDDETFRITDEGLEIVELF